MATCADARQYLEAVLPELRQFDYPTHRLVALFGLTANQAEQLEPSPCLCGAAQAGQWTAGVHHEAHRCARVITKLQGE